ncbi:MAG: EamA family transporter [Lachnospiraceae bacterium]|nr:EamA family transporter [Lachnospiraceae bacterium]
MWIFYAFGSALFAGLTSILAKCGIKKTDSNVATAIRTIVVLIFSWLMVFLVGSASTLAAVDSKTWAFLILSGLATGASWLCYFRALQIGDINKVVPIDKSSTVLTILLALIFLNEGISWIKAVSIAAIALGTWLMIQKKAVTAPAPQESSQTVSDSKPELAAASESGAQTSSVHRGWFLSALLSAVFASLTAILGKIGISGIESNLGTAIRTGVVLVMAWVVVFVTGKQHTIRTIPRNELFFICLSGLATGASWLCYYKALQDGPASVVVPIDKLSILVTIAFSYFVFKERLSRKALIGLCLIAAGTLAMLL